MPKPLRRTPDFPSFDTFPAPAVADGEVTDPGHLLPEGRLLNAAERVGRTLGASVSAVRDLPGRLDSLKDRLILVKGQGAARASETLGNLADDLKRNAGNALNDLKRTAAERTQQARRRAQGVANEYPLQVIAVAAGAAFLAGLTLRIWRENRG